MHAAYLAGFMDGEACIRIRKRTRIERIGEYYEVSIEIGQKLRDPLDAIQRTFGGKVTRKKGQNLYMLQWHKKRDVARVLWAALPYLINKKEQAFNALTIIN